MKNLAATLSAATLFTGLLAGPAVAGGPYSPWCTDNVGYFGQGISAPVTLGVELSNPPTSTNQTILLCYSTSATTTPNSIIGGVIGLNVVLDTNTTYPGAHANLFCLGDSNVSVGPISCSIPNGVNVAPFDVASVPAGGTCLVALNGFCEFFVPGVAVYPDNQPFPLLSITLAGVTVNLNVPARCVGILANC
jgi:hypothetical protein